MLCIIKGDEMQSGGWAGLDQYHMLLCQQQSVRKGVGWGHPPLPLNFTEGKNVCHY